MLTVGNCWYGVKKVRTELVIGVSESKSLVTMTLTGKKSRWNEEMGGMERQFFLEGATWDSEE